MPESVDPPESLQDQILWEDDQIIALNKPGGLLTLRDGYQPDLPYLAGKLQKLRGKIWVVHRLDKETSGVIVFAKTPAAHRHLSMQFENRQIIKTYHALVYGLTDWEEKIVDLPLRVNGDRNHRTVIDPVRGKTAQTNFRRLKQFHSCALISAVPHTGYRHQIRAHLRSIQCLIVGDELYRIKKLQGLPDSIPVMDRMALHAYVLSFCHPATAQTIQIEAPYPDDFQDLIETLESPPSV